MIASIAALLGLASLWALFRNNRAAFIGGFCVLFSLGYRIVDAAYVDLFGPLYAIETEKFVGGNNGTPMFVIACLTLIVPLWVVCRPGALLGAIDGPLRDSTYLRFMTNGALGGVSATLIILYGDMLRLGTIPLLSGIDRIEYRDMAGIFHSPAYAMNFLLSAIIGIFTVLPRLRGGRYSLTFVGLFVALQLYWALTGNRASAFVTTATFYAIPFAAVAAMNARRLLPDAATDMWSALVSARVITPLAIVGGIVVLISLVLNSYYDVRGYADPVFQMTQRIFVQPVQLWAETWQTVHFTNVEGVNHDALNRVLLNPDDPNTNTSILYLMEQSIGYFRTTELFSIGQQYAGGFPEIFFEVFGAWLAVPVMLAWGVATALVLRVTISNLLRGRVLTAIMGIYVLYGFSLTYIGGMLIFLLAPSFSIKIAVLIAVYFVERSVTAYHDTSGGRVAVPRGLRPAPIYYNVKRT